MWSSSLRRLAQKANDLATFDRQAYIIHHTTSTIAFDQSMRGQTSHLSPVPSASASALALRWTV